VEDLIWFINKDGDSDNNILSESPSLLTLFY
jgi:hypothetical protein